MKKSTSNVLLGAAFLMATSAIGPGFLTQTTVFTKQFLASFGFVILLSVVIDIFAQLNIWRVLTVSGKRGQDVANAAIPGSGYLLALLVAAGGLVFNIGNLAGTGLGLNVLFGDFGVTPEIGAAVSALIAIGIFAMPKAGETMDVFVKVLGVLMLVLIAYVVFSSNPPVAEAALRTFAPLEVDAMAVVTLVGGTVGGYITFAGAHRLIDAGVTGVENLKEVNRSAVSGIVLTAAVRFLLFLAALGVITLGFAIDEKNPPASVFLNAAGTVGYKFFGIVMWAAAITSVVGAAFTSVSFLKTLHPSIQNRERWVICTFIVVSAAVFILVGRPAQILVWAGTVNGFILPVALGLILLAAHRKEVVGEYRHPVWLTVTGVAVVIAMLGFSVMTLVKS
jgi:Mn2+/Fe2+ NRAMP family transporter